MTRAIAPALALSAILSLSALLAGPASADDEPVPSEALLITQRAEQAVADDPDDAGLWRALADARVVTGDYAEAIDAYAEMRERLATPNLAAEARAARVARLLDRREAYERYEETVMSSWRSAPPNSLGSSDLVAVGDVLRTRARSDSSLYQRALDSYEAAIRVDGSDPAPHVAIGELLLDRFNNAEALEAFRDALRLAPDYAPAMLGLARSQHFDRSSGAMDAVNALLEKQPEHVEALALKARLTLELEDYDAAEALVNDGLAVNPRSPELLTMLAAVHYLRSEQVPYQEAVAALQSATPGYEQLFVTLAEVAEQNRRYEDAVRFSAYVTRIQREAWRAHALLGTNALRLGDLSRAREGLETSFRGDPFNVLTKNKLELMDRLETFERYRSERFELVATKEEMPILRERVLPLAEQAFDYYEERYGYAPPTPIQLEFHPSHEDFSVRITGLVGIDIVGVAFGPLLALDSPSAEKSQIYNWAAVVWHEIAHSFHIGMTGSRVPRWFSEGLAVHEERLAGPGWGADIDPGFVVAYVEGKLARPSELNSAFLRPKYAQAVAHAYMQASLLMAMIERDHGFDAIVAMMRGYGAGETTEGVLEAVLDMDLATFDAAFDDYMQSRFGEMIAAIEREGDESGPRAGRYAELLKAGVEARESDPGRGPLAARTGPRPAAGLRRPRQCVAGACRTGAPQ